MGKGHLNKTLITPVLLNISKQNWNHSVDLKLWYWLIVLKCPKTLSYIKINAMEDGACPHKKCMGKQHLEKPVITPNLVEISKQF